MARARNIKPGFFMNEKLVELPYETRLMFIGLWTLADREGRMEDRPVRIKMSLFPADPIDADDLLQQLHDAGFILRYEVDGVAYIEVTAFTKHQNPHYKEAPSTIPAPDADDTGASPGFSSDDSDEAQGSGTDDRGVNPGQAPDEPQTSPADSGYLIPDTGSPQPETPGQPGREDDYPSRPALYEQRFETFWQAYPRKEDKKKCLAWFKRVKPDEELLERMLAALAAQSREKRWHDKERRQFIPLPTTWLNGERWNDEVAGVTPIRPVKSVGEMTEAERIRAEMDEENRNPTRGPGRLAWFQEMTEKLRAAEAKEKAS